MPTSPNLLIDHLVQSQASKEVTVNEAIDTLEANATEEFGLSIAGTGDYTLAEVDLPKAIHRLTGILSGNRNFIVPNRDKIYIVHNATTGAFTVTVKTSAGTGIIVEQGFKAIVYCDGTNVLDLAPAMGSGPYRTITGTSNTIRITDRIIFMDASGGNVSCTLPAASTAQGRDLLFIRTDSSANTCTINRAGSDDINNAATSKTITNVIGTAARFFGFSATRWLAQTLTAA